LYGATFDGAAVYSAMDPYLFSFSTHAEDTAFDREHGIRSQWDAYAGSGGYEGQAINVLSEQKSFPRATLIAGGFKLDQLLIGPFHSPYAALIRHAYEADAIMIGGYGFGDAHINRALQNRLERGHVEGPSRRPPVMILTTSPDNEWQMDSRGDMWSMEMRRALCAGAFRCEMLDSHTPAIAANLIPRRSFEVSSTHRVAVWHGGFVEAACELDRIVSWLIRGA
jgi:hypothetical protein